MLRMRSATAVSALLVTNLTIPARAIAFPPDVVSITTEGRAAGMNSNALEQAKQDALRKAVEQACGTFINAQTRTKDYAAVYDKVMAQAVGYVVSFEVVSRTFEGDTTVCKVDAKVSTRSFEQDWARFAHTLETEDSPRCVVVVVEDNDVEDNNPPKTDAVGQ